MLTRKIFPLVAVILLPIFFSSCDCEEPGTVAVTEDDDSFPIITWEVATAATDSEGRMISALTFYAEDENTIPVGINERVTVTLKAMDEQSGIKYIELKGGFGFTCINTTTSTANIYDGIIPTDSKDLSPVSGCAKVEATLDPIVLSFDICESPYTFSSGSYALTAIVHNHAGLERLTNLRVNVMP